MVTVVFNSFNLATGDNLIVRNGDLQTSPILGLIQVQIHQVLHQISPSGCLTFRSVLMQQEQVQVGMQ